MLRTLLALLLIPLTALATDQPPLSITQTAPIFAAAAPRGLAVDLQQPAPKPKAGARIVTVQLKQNDGQRLQDFPAAPFTLECFDAVTGKDFELLVDSGLKWAYLHVKDDTPRHLVIQVLKDGATFWRGIVTVDTPTPGPGPGPAPTPKPSWRFFSSLERAAAADKARPEDLRALADVFRRAALEKSFTTLGQYFAWLKLEYKGLPAGTAQVREVLADAMVVELGEGGTLDEKAKAAVAAFSKTVASCLSFLAEAGPLPPSPGPGPAPVPAAGLKVLLVRERQAALPMQQEFALQSTKIAAYLDAKCAKAENGRPAWRLWDPDQQISDKESATLKALMAEVKGKLTGKSCVVIKNDATPTQVLELPVDEAALLALLQKYGGA